MAGNFTALSLADVTASGNTLQGLYVPLGAGAGDIKINAPGSGISGASHFDGNGHGNYASGIFIVTGLANVLTVGDGTNAVTASGNTHNGVSLYLSGGVTIDGLTANGNDPANINSGGSGLLDQGNGALSVSNSVFGASGTGNGNDTDGIYLKLNTVLGPSLASATFSNVSAGYNGKDGLENNSPIAGTLHLTDFTADYNSGNGVKNEQTVTGGITIDPSHFDYNTTAGVDDTGVGPLNASGTSASARTTFDSNGTDGLDVNEPGTPAVVQVPVTLTWVEANSNGFGIGVQYGGGVELFNEDSIDATNSNFDGNLSVGVLVQTANTAAGPVSDTFDADQFNNNVSSSRPSRLQRWPGCRPF